MGDVNKGAGVYQMSERYTSVWVVSLDVVAHCSPQRSCEACLNTPSPCPERSSLAADWLTGQTTHCTSPFLCRGAEKYGEKEKREREIERENKRKIRMAEEKVTQIREHNRDNLR